MQRAGDGAETPESIARTAGRVLEGRYRLEAPLGEGGLGVVWRAVQLRLGKPVAVKLMQPEHVSRENLRARFEREARSLAALSHPNIVDVIDYGVDADAPFLVMELLEGRSLDRAIERGIAPERALAIARDVARALAHAHAQGIAHRDLKPANVFLQRIDDGSEIVRVLDFGLAKFLGEDERAGSPQITRQGMVLGTPAYMAPEQATGGSADARADVYSFGVMLFELLTGRRPFSGEGAELVRQHLLVATPSLASVRPDLEVAPELEALLQRATAKTPGERFTSARELMEALYAVPASAVRARPGATAPITSPLAHAATVSGEARTEAGEGSIATATSQPLGGTMPARPGVRAMPAAHAAQVGPPPASHAPASHAPFSHAPASHAPFSHAPASHAPASHAPASHAPASQAAVTQAPVSHAPARRPGRARALVVLAAVGALGALAGIAAVALLFLDPPSIAGPSSSPPAVAAPPLATPSTTSVEPAPPGATPVPAEPAGPTGATTPSEPYFAPDPDPWATPPPPALAAIRARLEGGATRLSQREVRALRNYVGRHPDDPRGWLLMGHGEYLTGARTNACQRFERALQADVARTRGDAWVADDLAHMAAHQTVGDRAAALLRTHWGTRAIPALDRAMVKVRREASPRDDVMRLVRLRDELLRGASHP